MKEITVCNVICYLLFVRTPEMLHHQQEQRRGMSGWRGRWGSLKF